MKDQCNWATPKQAEPADIAFDLWLQRGLRTLHDGVRQEPLPDSLLRLIVESATAEDD